MASNALKIATVLSVVLMVIGTVVLLEVADELFPTAYTATYNIANNMSQDTTELGAGPASLAGNVATWQGYMWVLVLIAITFGPPVALIAYVSFGLIKKIR